MFRFLDQHHLPGGTPNSRSMSRAAFRFRLDAQAVFCRAVATSQEGRRSPSHNDPVHAARFSYIER
jgi:hypothetical protein